MKKTQNDFTKPKRENCLVVQETVSIGKDIFGPFKNEYENFLDDSCKFNLLIRTLGQNPKVVRIKSLDAAGSQLELTILTPKDSIKRLVDFNIDFLLAKLKKGSKVYSCNTGKSDLGTEIYFLKLNGETFLKVWIENGTYTHLQDSEDPIYFNFSVLRDLLILI